MDIWVSGVGICFRPVVLWSGVPMPYRRGGANAERRVRHSLSGVKSFIISDRPVYAFSLFMQLNNSLCDSMIPSLNAAFVAVPELGVRHYFMKKMRL